MARWFSRLVDIDAVRKRLSAADGAAMFGDAGGFGSLPPLPSVPDGAAARSAADALGHTLSPLGPGVEGDHSGPVLHDRWAPHRHGIAGLTEAGAGGPPARRDVLAGWRPAPGDEATSRGAWERVAYRIALGIELEAHLEPLVNGPRWQVGFCARSEDLARYLAAAICAAGVEAAVVCAHPGGDPRQPACDVALPCRPGMSDEEIEQCVLAAARPAHTLFRRERIA